MVEGVVEFRPKLHVQLLPSKILSNHKVEIVRSWTIEIISWRIAEGTRHGDRKCGTSQIHGFVRSVLDYRLHFYNCDFVVQNQTDVGPVSTGAGVAVLI